MPAYNAARYLREAIASVLAQRVTDFELLVIDDGSTDETRVVAEGFAARDTRIRVLASPHAGVSAARNTGMRAARGDYFALLDSDDQWMPDYLTAQLAVFAHLPATDVVSGNALSLGGGALDGTPLNPIGTECRPILLLEMLERETAVCITLIMKRAVFEATGGFDESLARSEDYDLWIRAAHLGFHFVENPIPLARYRRRSDSASADELAMLTAITRVLRRARLLCAASPIEMGVIERQLTRFEAQRLLTSAKAHLLERDYRGAAADFERLSAVQPNVASRLLARASRSLPGVVRFAYLTKTALRA